MELLCLSSYLLLLLRDSIQNLLKFFVQHYTTNEALILENAAEIKEELKKQKPPKKNLLMAFQSWLQKLVPQPSLFGFSPVRSIPCHRQVLCSHSSHWLCTDYTSEGHLLLAAPDEFIYLYNDLSLCHSNCGKGIYTVPTNQTCYLSQHSCKLNRLHLWFMKNGFQLGSKFTLL